MVNVDVRVSHIRSSPEIRRKLYTLIVNGMSVRDIAKDAEHLIGIKRAKSWIHLAVNEIFKFPDESGVNPKLLARALKSNKKIGHVKGGIATARRWHLKDQNESDNR